MRGLYCDGSLKGRCRSVSEALENELVFSESNGLQVDELSTLHAKHVEQSFIIHRLF